MAEERARLGPWTRFLLRRALALAVTAAVLVVVTFAMVRFIPGDPARRVAGPEADSTVVEAVRAQLGLDQPVWQQFTDYVTGLFTLDLGNSFVSAEPVAKVIADRLPATLELTAVSLVVIMLFSLAVGIGFGALTREHRRPRLEAAFTAVTSLGGALPHYLVATFLVFFFAVLLRVLPVSGSEGPAALVLPVLAVSIGPGATLARLVRLETLGVLSQDYVRTARSKRLRTPTVYLRHVLPNVLTAALTIGGLLFAGLIGGALVTENVFTRPGLGTALVQAVLVQDYRVIQGIVLLLGVTVVVVNTVVDIVLGLVDRRSLVAAA
ncbi:peptide/nickel transport system permease protein [Crossiella equi]|uniref:Peptide/nickel transport system permease protein n=1 Tax=Crossiella equi TaxID=130796 RepID=A0ABS5ALM2_9PSEU|nr:ABC transporter permease [Crossiella equi]MBP2477472.1 peptide/nickel transport system permease protein [Crossiella equi]